MAKKLSARNKTTTAAKQMQQKTGLLTRLSLFFFDRPRFTATLFVLVLVFGLVSYTTLLKREGFPSVAMPISSVNGAYFVNDAVRVDKEVAKPISDIALAMDGVKSVQSQSYANFFSIFIQYDEGVDAKAASNTLEQNVVNSNTVPKQVAATYSVPYFGATGPAKEQIDIAVSFYGKDGQSTAEIAKNAEQYASALKQKNLPLVSDVFVQSPFTEAPNPATGALQTVQESFDRFGLRQETEGKPITNTFYNSVIIGIAKQQNADIIELDEQVRQAIHELNEDATYAGYSAEISASIAPSIQESIAELQRELIIALIAVLIVGSLVIAFRASVITVVSMVAVILAVVALLFLFGLSLNVITLFALILSLALIVDDTIIMVEAIDAQRLKRKDPRLAVKEATNKISQAMLSATFTAALSFAPLLFVGGILGSFIRMLPITIISALLVSLLVSLIFIPFMAKYLLLTPKAMGKDGVKEVAAGIEHKLAAIISRPMLWARGSTKRLASVGVAAVFIGLTFIGAGGYFATKVAFNIFPPSKDTNAIQVALNYAPGTTLQRAEALADRADAITATTLGENFEQASYFGVATERNASLQVTLISYNERSVTSPQLVVQLQRALEKEISGASVQVSQIDVGPPATAFTVAVQTEDAAKAAALAADLEAYLKTLTLTRASGTTAKAINVTPADPTQVSRYNGQQRTAVSVEFDGSDTSALFLLAQNAVEQRYTSEKLEQFGLGPDALVFDLGQESENMESFAALGIAFPILLLVIYILLAFQFRSLLQPILIFFAIPFSFLGISLSLYISDNPFSFFAMLGFFALIGLSIKNTILLTDYANQERRSGKGPIDAMVSALGERFRPLIATSITAVVALIPLSIISPFWQGLAVLIIFGLLSSTLLVITIFPYYYLIAEYLRSKISRKKGIALVVGTTAIVASIVYILS